MAQTWAHITAFGADDATKCEPDVEALTNARVFVAAIDTAGAAGGILGAVSGKFYTADQIEGQIGSVLANCMPGRRLTPVTTFSGIGAQGLASVEVPMERLKRQ